MYRYLTGVGAILAALSLAACGSSSAPTPSAAAGSNLGSSLPGSVGSLPGKSADATRNCQPDIVATICVTVSITGDAVVSGTAATEAPAPPGTTPSTTCAQLAAWKDTEHDLGGHIAAIGGHTLQWDEDLGHYHGPGTYDLKASDFYVNVDNASFDAYHDQSASVTVQPNYAVTYAFRGLSNQVKTISGTLKWTCLDPTS